MSKSENLSVKPLTKPPIKIMPATPSYGAIFEASPSELPYLVLPFHVEHYFDNLAFKRITD